MSMYFCSSGANACPLEEDYCLFRVLLQEASKPVGHHVFCALISAVRSIYGNSIT